MYIFSYVHHQNDISGHGVVYTYPEEWIKRYVDRNYIGVDPVYKLGWQRTGIFDWASLPKACSMSKGERLVMDEASDAGLKSGAAVSIHLGYGSLIGFAFACKEKHSFSKDHLSQLYAMAGQFQLSYFGYSPNEIQPPAALSTRQKEVLQWVATGKTRSQIAEIMAVTEDTVDDHLRHIFRKLRCNDRVVAVLKAIQIGAISV